ncbi:MAG: twin-arginine translocase subunit TatC [Phycisphaeraceae bacterium]
MAAQNPEDLRMSLGEHLEELRWRLFLGIIGPLIAAIVMLVFGKQVVGFLAQPVLVAMDQVGLEPRLINPSVTSAFAVYLKVSLLGGLIIGIPWLFWQLWLFVGPGLYHTEQRMVRMLIPASTGLMIVGVAFLYYVMLPMMLWFLLNFAVGFEMPDLNETLMQQQVSRATSGGDEVDDPIEDPEVLPLNIPRLRMDPAEPEIGDMWLNITSRQLRIVGEDGLIWHTRLTASRSMMDPLIQIDQYINLVMLLALAFSIAFQLPLVMLVLGKVGIVSYYQMASVRRYALLAIVVVSAIVTPADPFSQVGLAIPMYALYELGLLLVKWFGPPPEEAWGSGVN